MNIAFLRNKNEFKKAIFCPKSKSLDSYMFCILSSLSPIIYISFVRLCSGPTPRVQEYGEEYGNTRKWNPEVSLPSSICIATYLAFMIYPLEYWNSLHCLPACFQPSSLPIHFLCSCLSQLLLLLTHTFNHGTCLFKSFCEYFVCRG